MNRKGILNSCLILVLCAGCATSTVTPDYVKAKEASYDASTPPQYDPWNSGLLLATTDARGEFDGVVLTEGGRDFFVFLIQHFALQYREKYGLDLTQNNGVKAYKDQFKNDLWWIGNTGLEAMQIMTTWLRSGKDPDSFWMKAKEKITPMSFDPAPWLKRSKVETTLL